MQHTDTALDSTGDTQFGLKRARRIQFDRKNRDIEVHLVEVFQTYCSYQEKSKYDSKDEEDKVRRV